MELSRLSLPRALGDPGSDAVEELVGMLNAISLQLWGDDDFAQTAQEAYASLREQEYHAKVVVLAREDGALVGRMEADLPLADAAETASLLIDVLPSYRGRGIGSALLREGEEIALGAGRRVASIYTEHPVRTLAVGDHLIRTSAGSSGLPSGAPEVRFALRHGYRLGQIERSSELTLPLPPATEAGLTMTVPGYRLVSWFGAAPSALIDAFAALKSRMSTDVPQSGIDLDPEPWNASRVRAQERELSARSEPLLVTAALHEASGELAAYTELAVPADGAMAEQYDTLVAAHHRGNRLGTFVKLRNLQELRLLAPRVRRVITWNADENDPMLAINRAFGFRPHALTGHWQKTLE